MGGPSSTFPHHYPNSNPCPPYRGPGPGGMTSSQSSDNYTSCSCESCSLTSPSSTSFSVQVTDETYDSSHLSTPSDVGGDGAIMPRYGAGFTPPHSAPLSAQLPPDVVPAATPDVIPVQRHSSISTERISAAPSFSLPLQSHRVQQSCLTLSPLVLLSSLPPGQSHALALSDPLGAMSAQRKKDEEISPQGPTPRVMACAPKQAVLSSKVTVFAHCNSKEEQKQEKEEEDEEEDDDDEEEDHFRHRRLTGDSGIEVCRCHVRREEREKEELQKGFLGKEGKKNAKGEEKEDLLKNSMYCSLGGKANRKSSLLDNYTEQRGNLSSSSSSSTLNQKTGKAIVTVEAL